MLAYVPTVDTLEFAMRLASRSSLCIMEGSLDRVRWWAGAVGAVDLTTGRVDELDEQLAAAAERLRFYSNNGFADTLGKRVARQTLEDLHNAGQLDADQVAGLAIGVGASDRAAKRLAAMAERLG